MFGSNLAPGPKSPSPFAIRIKMWNIVNEIAIILYMNPPGGAPGAAGVIRHAGPGLRPEPEKSPDLFGSWPCQAPPMALCAHQGKTGHSRRRKKDWTMKRHLKSMGWILALLLISPLPAAALVLGVPDPYRDIQAAIEDAADGDTVLVADGVYAGPGNCGLDFRGKDIRVQSVGGPTFCIIDCQNLDRGVFFHQGESAAAVLSGFTIQNGMAYIGAGIYCINASPTIENCIIIRNTAQNTPGHLVAGGGGIAAVNCAPAIRRCVVKNNAVSGGAGGGLYISGGAPMLENSVVSYNETTGGAGGGIYAESASPQIINCTIRQNKAGGTGGGLHSAGQHSLVHNTIVWGNRPDQMMGQVRATYCDIQGGWEGAGNFYADPLFVSAGDIHLTPGSPCRDKGNLERIGETDVDGHGRVWAGLVDVGADEFVPSPYPAGGCRRVFQHVRPGDGGH